MSNRNTKFINEIIPSWENIQKSVESIDTKGLSSEEINEIAHLKKVFTHFSEMLPSVDPYFIPLQTISSTKNLFDNINSNLSNYINNRNITHITTINNDYFDTLLKDLMPFIFYKGRAGKSMQSPLRIHKNN